MFVGSMYINIIWKPHLLLISGYLTSNW